MLICWENFRFNAHLPCLYHWKLSIVNAETVLFLYQQKDLQSKLVRTHCTCSRCNLPIGLKHQLPWCYGCLNGTNTNQCLSDIWYLYLSLLGQILWDPGQLSWHIYRTDCAHTQGKRYASCVGHILLFSTIGESEQCSLQKNALLEIWVTANCNCMNLQLPLQ